MKSRTKQPSGIPNARRKKARQPKPSVPPASAELDPKFSAVLAAFAKDRRVTSGKMMASVGLKVNGKIFAMMVQGRFVAKLPKGRVDELVRSRLGEHFDPRKNGRVMKEWVVLNGTRPPWIELAKEAHRFVGGSEA